MKNFSNLNISCKVVFSLNKWNKKVGSPSSFGRKRPFISLNSSASIRNLSSSERARARARANHAKNDAQKGCAMQLNGITLIQSSESTTTNGSFRSHHSNKKSMANYLCLMCLLTEVWFRATQINSV